MGAGDILERLSQLAPSVDVPYLTVTVDWTVEGTSPGRTEPEEVKRSQSRSGTDEGIRWRPAIEILEQEIEDLIEEHGPRGDVYDSLTEDYKKITEFLENDLDPAAQGAIIVANSSLGIFEASGFSLQMPTGVTLSPVPALYSLVRLVEDNPVYGVLLAVQQDATLSFFAHGGITRTVSLEASGYPRHQQSGGWSQRRY
jgi:hypothetical protein